MKSLMICICALAMMPLAVLADDLPANSTEPMGQSFPDVRVLFVGSGDHHHFPRFFLTQDRETVGELPGVVTAATPNLEEALYLLPQADVVVFSGNHRQWGGEAFQEALHAHADAGKGLVMLHAATWNHNWDDGRYNARFIAGASGSHGGGEFEVDVNQPEHPVMTGVPENFSIRDESYRHEFIDGADVEVLATNGAGADEHASVWTVNDPATRIVCITLGHDAASRRQPFNTLLQNAVLWAAGRDDVSAARR